MGFEFDHEKIPLYKLIVHIIQIVISVTIWVLEIIVFKGGDINGNNGWTFGVVSLPRSRSHASQQMLISSSNPVLPVRSSMDISDYGPAIPSRQENSRPQSHARF